MSAAGVARVLVVAAAWVLVGLGVAGVVLVGLVVAAVASRPVVAAVLTARRLPARLWLWRFAAASRLLDHAAEEVRPQTANVAVWSRFTSVNSLVHSL